MGEGVVRIPAKVVGESDGPRWTVDLPTKDMVAKALPEGVLDSGGEVSGLLYFHKVDNDVNRLHLDAQLESASSQTQLASIEIPFVVK